MPTYDRPTRELMHEWAGLNLEPGRTFESAQVIEWFEKHYPLTKKGTVIAHVHGMAVNTQSRHSHSAIKPGSGHDLFYRVGRGTFRLWDQANDPVPIYKSLDAPARPENDVDEDEAPEGSTFALEAHLQDFLIKNLGQIEQGLTLYDDEGLTGREYPADNRRIDILAVDAQGAFVVIETKVGKAYDRVIGQLMFYKNWVAENLETDKPVRGIIIGSEISPSLRLATKNLPDIELVEYELAFSIQRVVQ